MESQPVIIKNYKGRQADVTGEFQKDAPLMAMQHYYPSSQSYAEGSYGCKDFVIGIILCATIIGIPVVLYMIIVKPKGGLTVTYQLKAKKVEPPKKQHADVAGQIKQLMGLLESGVLTQEEFDAQKAKLLA